MATKDKNDYPGTDINRDLPFESPQNEESARLAKSESEKAVVRKEEEDNDVDESRGGNQSINKS